MLSLHKIRLGPLSKSLKFGLIPTCGCLDILYVVTNKKPSSPVGGWMGGLSENDVTQWPIHQLRASLAEIFQWGRVWQKCIYTTLYL